MRIISFYTENTIYEKEIEDLRSSCNSLQIEHTIEKRKDLGTWEKNCAQKPLFIYECLEKFNAPLLWVDADGIVLQKPTLDLPSCDIALYFNDEKTLHARNATIYVRPTKQTKEFLLLWHQRLEELNQQTAIPDQPVMIDLIREMPELKIEKLPLSYMHIFDRDPLEIEKAVIIHFQASRTAKMDPIFWKHLSGKELKAHRINLSGGNE